MKRIGFEPKRCYKSRSVGTTPSAAQHRWGQICLTNDLPTHLPVAIP